MTPCRTAIHGRSHTPVSSECAFLQPIRGPSECYTPFRQWYEGSSLANENACRLVRGPCRGRSTLSTTRWKLIRILSFSPQLPQITHSDEGCAINRLGTANVSVAECDMLGPRDACRRRGSRYEQRPVLQSDCYALCW